MTDRYHHGDLPNALRRAATEVILEKGVGGFSLREVARRAGVSHNAPAHHFGDTTGLLTSLAIEAFEHLAENTRGAIEGIDDPEMRLVALGQAYVRTGATYPAHCEIMFRDDLIDEDDPALQRVGLDAYTVLVDAVAYLADTDELDIDVDEASRLCWSAMQGLLVLHPSMTRLDHLAGREPVGRDHLVTRFTETIIAGLRR